MAPTSKKSPNKKSKHALNKFQKPSKQSFKPKSKSDHTVKSQAAALQLEDDVPDFPRGGGSSLSKEELDEVHAEVDAEFDAEGRGLKKRKNKRLQKQSHSAEDDLGSLFGGGISGKLPRGLCGGGMDVVELVIEVEEDGGGCGIGSRGMVVVVVEGGGYDGRWVVVVWYWRQRVFVGGGRGCTVVTIVVVNGGGGGGGGNGGSGSAGGGNGEMVVAIVAWKTGVCGVVPNAFNVQWKARNISPGMKLWGVIAEINEKDITISLPGGLRGLVRASEGFDPFSDTEMKNVQNKFFSSTCYVGQLVACIVLQLDDDKKEKGKRKIWLSLRLSLLHKSLSLDVIQEGMTWECAQREGHILHRFLLHMSKALKTMVYILHFGLPSFTGFMPKNSEAESTTIKISLGHLLQGVVKSIDRTRKVVYLSSDPDTVSKYVTRELKGISIDLLIPGMMVNARVKSTLENGIMLSFLTYFTGTVDMSHLQKTFPTSNWKDDYNQNKKVNARILFIDPSTRAVGLTLNPHLVHNKAPPSLVKTGDIFDRAKVIRVDRGSGLLLEVPSSPFPTPAYVSVTDVADKEVSKLEKTFKEGSHVRVRILGLKHLEGLAVGVLKTSAFEGSVFTHSDVKPGMVVKAKIIAVDSFGAIVQFSGGVKALCPLRHMSEFEMSKPRKKFQVGAELLFRVLGCKSKRITVTHKKTLVKSKLGIISSYTDATEGLITHGWITKIENHGCFVRFYNGVQGFAPRSELGLEPGCDPISAYHVEEVVKCRVTSSVPASRRINLSFIITPARVSEDDMVKLGRIVSGVVERVTPHVVVVRVNTEGYMKGTISTEHLSDHQGFAALMKSVLKPGYEFDQLLVLGECAGLSGYIGTSLKQFSPLLKFEQLSSFGKSKLEADKAHLQVLGLDLGGCIMELAEEVDGGGHGPPCPPNTFVPAWRQVTWAVPWLGQEIVLCSLAEMTEGDEFRRGWLTESGAPWRAIFGWNLVYSVLGSLYHAYRGATLKGDHGAEVLGGDGVRRAHNIVEFECNFGAKVLGSNGAWRAYLCGVQVCKLGIRDVEGNNVILTAKYSLINSAEKLPVEISQIRPRTVIHGYVCNLIESGCFVRYIGRLTGFVPRSKATDERKANFSEAFYIGQSVRSYITDVCSETSRVTLSLKQSLCSSTDASFIQEHFLLEDKIANLQLSNSTRPELKWVKDFTIGDVVEGKVNDVKDFGVVVGFEKYSDVFGFVTHYQLGGFGLETGSIIRAAILDVTKIECLVDLSLKPSFVDRLNEESSNIETNKKVLSIPEHNFAIGYASLTDYNTQKFPSRQHVNGQSVIATIMALPSPATAGRLLLLLKSMSEVTETSSSKRAKKKSNYDVGALVQAEITEIKPLELKVKFGSGFQGRVHITEASDDNIVEDPFKGFRIGQTLAAAIVLKNVKSENKRKNYHWELSIKRTLVTGSEEIGDKLTAEDFSYSVGQHVTGFVYKVDKDWVWLTVSRNVKAQLYLLDSACEPTELLEFQKRYYVGKTISGYILSADKERKLVRLVLQPFSAAPDRTRGCRTSTIDGDSSLSNVVSHIHEGDVVGGRISKILPGLGGMLIQIDPRLHGKVNFTELKDLWESDPLSGYHEGQFVKCKVLEVSHSVKGTFHIDLSLRSSLIGVQSQKSICVSNNVNSPSQRVESIEDIHPNMTVQGYVKNVTPKGCFIMLSRNLDAKILLSNLSDGFVKNPEKDFPIGKLVVGKVISVEPLSKRVEVTLKTPNASSAQKSYISGSLKVGDIVSGRIKRIESYGLFITVDDTNMVGLCHVSELSDDHVDNIETKYRAGEKVTVKVLKVDEDRHRISLGMKNSYFSENYDVQAPSKKKSDDEDDENDHMVGTQLNMLPGSGSSGIQSFDIEYENGEHPVLADVEARASILPLEVPLDDIENSGMDDVIYQCKEQADDVNAIDEKSKRRAKRKEKEEREREIMAAEERLLEKDIPRSADEFEKLVRSSPNSSFIWIKYMAFMLSLADVENARSIAERY
ncbi:similar to RIBOSOMAL RNA PROCESSING 5 [Actinidia rufa]|uniref:rRNA biogenesis protein RRP5 n=1 Tax=Actinidia rufa TaxID=165716 RepID=A0A7J0E2K4_9ERIC|nr:similar to RIBOSOMAL RNA PROCESSING 5 [Actinidia rufa]